LTSELESVSLVHIFDDQFSFALNVVTKNNGVSTTLAEVNSRFLLEFCSSGYSEGIITFLEIKI